MMSLLLQRATRSLLCACVALSWLAALPAHADEPVTDGARALRSPDFPWYDEDADQLKPVKRPRQPANWRMPQYNFGLGPIFGQLVQIVFVALLVGALAVLVYFLVRAYLNREKSEAEEMSGDVMVIDDQARIEHLPFNVKEPKGDLLEQARSHYQKGEFNDAIIYLYSYMLVHLDRNRVIRLSKGKTNRQYLGEVSHRPAVMALLERTMVCFEEAFFGRHVLDRTAFEACWKQLDRFHSSVTEAASS